MVRSRSEDGASAVEFALVMVPLLTLVFGILQYGLYFWSMQGGADTAGAAVPITVTFTASSFGLPQPAKPETRAAAINRLRETRRMDLRLAL